MDNFDLKREIEKFQPFDELEAEDQKKCLDFLESDEDKFVRTNLKRHFIGDALVVDGKGNVLLNFHKALNMWIMFGGHADGEENLLNVAIRELREESGITEFELASDGIFDISVALVPENKLKNEPEHHHYNIAFLMLVKNYDFKISEESNDITWFTSKEAYEKTASVFVKRQIKKYEKMLADGYFDKFFK